MCSKRLCRLGDPPSKPNAVPMWANRLRRWPHIGTALGECHVFAGPHDVLITRYFTPHAYTSVT